MSQAERGTCMQVHNGGRHVGLRIQRRFGVAEHVGHVADSGRSKVRMEKPMGQCLWSLGGSIGIGPYLGTVRIH